MDNYPNFQHRRSIRLEEYDYTQNGAYFITICTHSHVSMFGEINDEIMDLNRFGEIVADTWKWLGSQYEYVEIDEFVIMPNHLHGILILSDSPGASRSAPTQAQKRKPIGRLIGVFKTVSTKQINEFRKTSGQRLWQRNFWEHVIRDEKELHASREYIVNNPLKWELDKLNNGG